jgi:hypothetical protein
MQKFSLPAPPALQVPLLAEHFIRFFYAKDATKAQHEFKDCKISPKAAMDRKMMGLDSCSVLPERKCNANGRR